MISDKIFHVQARIVCGSRVSSEIPKIGMGLDEELQDNSYSMAGRYCMLCIRLGQQAVRL